MESRKVIITWIAVTVAVMFALPFAVAGMMAMVNPRYIEPLFTQKIGQIFVGGALVLELIGFIIIQKIASLDV